MISNLREYTMDIKLQNRSIVLVFDKDKITDENEYLYRHSEIQAFAVESLLTDHIMRRFGDFINKHQVFVRLIPSYQYVPVLDNFKGDYYFGDFGRLVYHYKIDTESSDKIPAFIVSVFDLIYIDNFTSLPVAFERVGFANYTDGYIYSLYYNDQWNDPSMNFIKEIYTSFSINGIPYKKYEYPDNISKIDFYIRSYKTLDVHFICDTRIPDTFKESAFKLIEEINL